MLAKALGVDVKTWRRIREEDPEAKAAWEEARALEQDRLVGELFSQAINDHNTTAAIFLLKSRHGYRDRGEAEGVSDNRPTININIPAPLKPEDYAKLITIAPDAEHVA